MSDIEESYKNTIVGHLVNSGTEDLLLHIVQCWREFSFNEEKLKLPIFMCFLVKMYRYYSYLGCFSIKNNEERKIFILKYSTIYHI